MKYNHTAFPKLPKSRQSYVASIRNGVALEICQQKVKVALNFGLE